MEEINNTSVEEVSNVTEENKEETKEKTYTEKEYQEALNKAIQKRLARERKDIEAKIEAERKEAEELAKLSEAEKQRKLFEKQVKEFEETKRAFEQERLLNETTKQLASKNLPVEFAEMLKGTDAESTFENIKAFEEKFNAALEVKVNERLKGNVPKAAAKTNTGITKEQFNQMTYNERVKLFEENKDLYYQLTK